jgi:hypothetical protein
MKDTAHFRNRVITILLAQRVFVRTAKIQTKDRAQQVIHSRRQAYLMKRTRQIKIVTAAAAMAAQMWLMRLAPEEGLGAVEG